MSGREKSDNGGRPLSLRLYIPTALAACVGAVMSWAAFKTVQKWELEKASQEFQREAGNAVATLETGITNHLETLRFLEGFYCGSQLVERKEFDAFVAEALPSHPGYQALEWIPRVPASEREAFEEAVRREGFPQFRIHPLAERSEYYPVDFVVPYPGNEKAHGYDLGSHPDRLEALERARDSGQMAATSPIQLIQEVGGQSGFLVFQPVYDKDAPHETIPQRRANLRGFVLAVFRIGDLIDSMFEGLDTAGIRLCLYDNTEAGHPRMLYYYPSGRQGRTPGGGDMTHSQMANTFHGLRLSQRLDVAGRQWSLGCYPSSSFLATHTTWAPQRVLAAGAVLTLLLTGYLGLLKGQSARIDRLVAQRTAELTRVNDKLRAAVDQGKKAEEGLREARDHLDSRVREQTQELASANQQLRTEIAERKRAEEALRQSEEHYRLLVETMTEGLAVQKNRVVTFVNDSFCRMLGYSREELIGREIGTLFDEAGRLMLAQQMAEQREDSSAHYEIEFTAKDGRKISTLASPRPMDEDDEHYRASFAVFTDITERKQAQHKARRWEEQLTHASRLNTMGEMASGIAHELNQPLAAIANYAGACLMAIQGGKAKNEKLLDNLEELLGQTGRAGDIIRRLRSFVRRREPHRSSVDVNHAVEEVMHFVASEARLSGVQVRLRLAAHVPTVLGDSIEIQQVILNLVRNALEAMDEGQDGERVLTVSTSSVANGAVEVTVTDTGGGVPAEAGDRLFEPFHTTKPQGLGLGLAISRSIIEIHGGDLTATNNPDRGMTFRFSLPVGNGEQNDAI